MGVRGVKQVFSLRTDFSHFHTKDCNVTVLCIEENLAFTPSHFNSIKKRVRGARADILLPLFSLSTSVLAGLSSDLPYAETVVIPDLASPLSSTILLIDWLSFFKISTLIIFPFFQSNSQFAPSIILFFILRSRRMEEQHHPLKQRQKHGQHWLGSRTVTGRKQKTHHIHGSVTVLFDSLVSTPYKPMRMCLLLVKRTRLLAISIPVNLKKIKPLQNVCCYYKKSTAQGMRSLEGSNPSRCQWKQWQHCAKQCWMFWPKFNMNPPSYLSSIGILFKNRRQRQKRKWNPQ